MKDLISTSFYKKNSIIIMIIIIMVMIFIQTRGKLFQF